MQRLRLTKVTIVGLGLVMAVLAAACSPPASRVKAPTDAPSLLGSPTTARGDDEALTAPLTADAASAGVHCGYVRWAVKTGADPRAGAVNVTPKAATIAQLTAMKSPFKAGSGGSRPPNYSRFPAEQQVYSLSATLTAYNIEQDSDLHLALTSGKDHMIVEIPNPACVRGGPFLTGIADARKAFLTKTGYKPVTPPPGKYSPPFVTTNIHVTVTGVLFFDFVHGQHGVAPNGVELHPLLSIAFG